MISDPPDTALSRRTASNATPKIIGCSAIALVVMLIGSSLVGWPVMITLVLVVPIYLAVLYGMLRQADLPTNPREIEEYARSLEPDAPPPVWRNGVEEFPLGKLDTIGKPPRPPMTTHAITAAENVERDYQHSGALAIDLGLLVYSGDSDKPAVYREAPVPDSASYVQPFAEVWLEEPLQGGTVRLMLLDPDGVLRFVSEAVFDRDDAKGSGRHTVLSPTRLPIGDHLPVQRDGWRLKIEVRGKCVADHLVNWFTPGSANALVDHMATDGELTVDLAALVEQVALTPLSLDELLGGQKPTNAESHR